MLRRFAVVAVLSAAAAARCGWAATGPENEIRDFIAGWNAAYTGLDADALAILETADFQLVDRFGHWIRSEGPEFNRQLWAMAFREVYTADGWRVPVLNVHNQIDPGAERPGEHVPDASEAGRRK